MTAIDLILKRVLDEYPLACKEDFKAHPLAEFVRKSFVTEIRQVIDSHLLVKGSVGQGIWAETPWLSVFDPAVTTSAQRGVYVVYLFDQVGRHVYLSLNQATTEVKDEFKSRYEDVLKDRAEFVRELLHPYGIADLVLDPLDLTGNGDLTRGYCAGNIVAICYSTTDIPSDHIIRRDLNRLLNLYATYAAVKNGDLSEGEEVPENIRSRQEVRKYRWHRRAERNSRLSADAKKFHGSNCMVCGFNFEQRYGERGRDYIEAHHVVPFSELIKEVEPVLLDPRTDFVVVCANCHRMLHRTRPPLRPDELKRILK